jgi:hypothetical protein
MIAAVTTRVTKMTAIAAVVAACAFPTTARAASITATIPFQRDIFPACNGDTIHLSGQLLVVLTATANSSGGVMFASHLQPQNVTGVDLQTGTKFIGTGLSRDLNVFTSNGTATFTFVNRFHIQATTGAESFDVSETIHVTLLADGTVTAAFDNFSPACS